MNRALAPLALLTLVALATTSASSSAQPGQRSSRVDSPASAGAPTNLRANVGAEVAARLLRSSDPEERLRGIARAASIGSPEAVALLVAAAEPSSPLRADSRALVALARALAPFAPDQERARTALLAVVNTGKPGLAGRMPQGGRAAVDSLSLEDGDPVARAELARQVAALALGRSGVERARELLYGAARSGGAGQTAALHALTAHPPREPGFFGTAATSLPVPVVQLLGELGDLRALEPLHAAQRSTDPSVRAAALLAIAALGDERGIALARTALVESDLQIRAAAAEALVLLGAPERVGAVTALVRDDATIALGIRLAERVFDAELTKQLAARAELHPAHEVRLAAIRALGRSPEAGAATALASRALLDDPRVQYHAALALARSPAPNAGALVGELAAGSAHRRLWVRAYLVRAMLRGERHGRADATITKLATSRLSEERALGLYGAVALGEMDVISLLGDRDVAVRRAAAMGSLARPSAGAERALLARMQLERDPLTRTVLAIGLAGGDPSGTIADNRLLDRAEGGGPDAALAAHALARRADEASAAKLSQLLGSRDAIIRAHVARGLGAAPLPDASGRLASAYAFETDVDVRRAIVTALAARGLDATAPSRRETLELAARLDPDALVRRLADSALGGPPAPAGGAVREEVAWLRVTRDDGSPPGAAYAGALLRADGISIPIVFDEEGYAIVAKLPPGEARLVLSPRLP